MNPMVSVAIHMMMSRAFTTEPKMVWVWSGKEATRENIKECVGNGWGKILDELVTDLLELGWNGRLAQVKEKFGGLRFYIESAIEPEIHARIERAMNESERTCETCGQPGKTRSGGWVKTHCDLHAEEWKSR